MTLTTNQEVINALNTTANRAAYAAADDKGWFAQDLIENLDISVSPESALVEAVEIALDAMIDDQPMRFKMSHGPDGDIRMSRQA